MVNVVAMVVNQLNKHQTSINQQKTVWISMMKLVKTTFKQILIYKKTPLWRSPTFLPYLHWLYKHYWPHKQTHILYFMHTLNICLYNLLRVTTPVGFDWRWESSPLFFFLFSILWLSFSVWHENKQVIRPTLRGMCVDVCVCDMCM